MRVCILCTVPAPDRCKELRLQSARGIVYAECKVFELVARMNRQRQCLSPQRCRAGHSIKKFADALRESETPEETKEMIGDAKFSGLGVEHVASTKKSLQMW